MSRFRKGHQFFRYFVIALFKRLSITLSRDVGLGKIGRSHPNILTMAAGGYGENAVFQLL